MCSTALLPIPSGAFLSVRRRGLSCLLAAFLLPALLTAVPAEAQEVVMSSGATAQVSGGGTWNLQGSQVDLGPAGSTARLRETGRGRVANGRLRAIRSLSAPAQANPAGLGAILSASVDLGDVTITRGHAVQSLGGDQTSLRRYYAIEPSQNNDGLSAALTLTYADAERGGLPESQLVVFKSTDGGQTWTDRGADSRDPAANTVTLDSVGTFSRWTLGSDTTVTNGPPVARADSFQTPEGQTLTVPPPGVLANDSDPDGDSLSASLVTGVSSGSLTLDADGSFQYTPDAGFAGTDQFAYEASDGTASDTAQVTIAVQGDGTCPLAWSLALTGTDIAGNSRSLTFGQSSGATAGRDPACGEDELPPQPPSDVFDVRFTGATLPGVTLGNGTEADIRPTDTPTPAADTTDFASAIWRVELQTNDDPVTLSWDAAAADSILTGTLELVDAATGGDQIQVNMKTRDYVTIGTSNVTAVEVRLDRALTRSVPTVDGWALVSIPVDAPDQTFGALLPSCLSGFAYQPGAGYAPINDNDPVPPGRGFFANCTGGPTSVTGRMPDAPSVSVEQGWNAVGPFAEPVPVGAVTGEPSGIVETPFFGFATAQGYQAADTLRPGRAYWVRTGDDGTLAYDGPDSTGAAVASMATSNESASTAPLRLVLTDAAGRTATLRFVEASSEQQRARHALPPRPPGEVFDVRFASGRSAAPLPESGGEEARHTIELQGLTYPADVQLKEAGAAEQAVRLRAGPRALRLGPDARSATIAEEMIPEETGQLQVDIRPLPSTFALKKSRPNPATRRATIEYAVPEQSDVTVAVYDVLGRRVARLVDGPQPAGRHQARIDATRLPSGTYFVRMRAEDFTKTRRLTVTR